jgi:hypothetical protein
MNQFVSRVANYIANEVLIKGLANSRTFQRFVLRTDKSLQDIHKSGADTISKTFEGMTAQQMRDVSAQAAAAGPPRPPTGGFPGFVSAFFKEIRKDLGISH